MPILFIRLVSPFILFSMLLLLSLSLSRGLLALWQIERVIDLSVFFTLMLNGIRVDLSSIGYLLVIPAILHPVFMLLNRKTFWLYCLKIYFLFVFVGIVFFELATPAFINEYGFRPNRLFIEYLVYPKEVMNMLINGHMLTIISVFSVLILMGVMYWRFLTPCLFDCKNNVTPCYVVMTSSICLLLFTLFLCARGTVGHRPLNPSLVYFSTDPLINSLTLNSIYSVAHAYKQFGHEKNAAAMYGSMPSKKIIELIQKETHLPDSAFNHSLPSVSLRQPVYQGQPKNLVIVLEESLGAQFVKSLGGIDLTPNIDDLMNESWAFERLYATGTRSVRGIEAVITGFTPTPARAVVKLDNAQHNFFTIAGLLKAQGYSTQFVYGGESHFDNMKSFFLGNGFTDIVDFDDIEEPDFVGSWGASDGDLFKQADIELQKSHASGKPFFSLIFSSSNHDPFEIPEGKITPLNYNLSELAHYNDKERARHQAVQYADFALGEFIAKAKTQDYWQNTVFLVVADHDARATGADLVPVPNFHIPGFILNAGVANQKDNRIVSHIDLAPTLLSLMGVENHSPMLGQDLIEPSAGHRAMMQYADNFAYMQGEQVVILQPEKAPLYFSFLESSTHLLPGKLNESLADTALAHVLWGSLAYQNNWYQLPKQAQLLLD